MSVIRRLYFLLLLGLTVTSLAQAQPSVPIHAPLPDAQLETQLLADPTIAALLSDRRYQRPERCPLRVLKHEDLQAKLQAVANALKYGECYNRNQALVQGLDEIAKQTSIVGQAAMTRGVFTNGVSTTVPAALANNSKHKELISSLEKVAVDEECISNIRNRGLLPVVADIATNIGQMALFIPSPNGFMVGIGAVGLGATLKVVWSLLKAPFDWKLASDRDQFLDINCSFFDLRRDIEAAEIMEPFDARLDNKIAATQTAVDLLQAKIEELHGRMAAMNDEVEAASEAAVLHGEGKLRFDLARNIETFLGQASELTGVAAEARKFNVVNLFMDASPRFISAIEKLGEQPAYWTFLKGQLEKFSWSNMAMINATAEEDLLNNLCKPITQYLESYLVYLHEREERLAAKFYERPVTESPYSVGAYQNEAMARYTQAITPLQEALGRVYTRLHVLESKQGKKTYKDNDDSAHGTFSVLQEYQVVQERIYGKVGYSFLEYFRKQLKYDKIRFTKGYKKFAQQTVHPLTGQDLKWACRDANQLRLLWESANASAEVAYDMIATNRGIFHSQVKYLKTFLYFIPVGRTSQYLMYRHVRGAEEMVDKLAVNYPIDWHSTKKWGFRKSHNLGRLMVEIKRSEAMRRDVEAYLQRQQCLNFL